MKFYINNYVILSSSPLSNELIQFSLIKVDKKLLILLH